jgi:hypothetical protein
MRNNLRFNTQSIDPIRIPFRIRIGVTGHRQISDEKIIAEKINRVLTEYIFELFDKESNRIFSAATNASIAFSILTPLAEGADRLVAKEVLKLPNSIIEAVLPLAKEDYLNDFATQESQKEFEALLSQSRHPVILRKQLLKEEYPLGDLADARRRAYENVGRYIVDHCDALIALWDEESSRCKGGTADIVDYAKKRKRPLIIISTTAPYNISIYKGSGISTMPVSKIEMFNTFHIPERMKSAYILHMYKQLFDNPEGEKLPEDARALVREILLPFYLKASLIAKRNQKIYKYVGTSAYLLSTAAIASVAIGLLFHGLSSYAFLLEFILLAIILFLITMADRRRSHKNWIESRFLTERIRSAIFLTVCGLEPTRIEVPPYMRAAHHPDAWMVKIFNELCNMLPQMKGRQEDNCFQFSQYVRKHWVEDQIRFHENMMNKAGRLSHFLEQTGIFIFYCAMAAALSHFCLMYFDLMYQSIYLEKVLIFLALVLPATGAAIGGIRTHREYSRTAKRSQHMKAVLEDLAERLTYANSPKSLEALIRETELLMLRETQSWMMIMRFAELDAVA